MNTESKYYNIDDTTKIDAFLSIPKVLFSDKRFKTLSIPAKFIYSLYLNRYIVTTYKDKVGPYIIYSDTDIIEKLKISESTCCRARAELKNVKLINYKRSVGNNKLYLYNYNNKKETDEFYYENDLENYSFFRFPNELFENTYQNLPLSTKLQYAIYFDTMCLSQMNYFVDEKERIYFQESLETQEKKLGLSVPTLTKGRKLLKICGLLFEYRPFSQDTRYYLIKLFNFTDRVNEYNQLSPTDKKKSIKEISDQMKKDLISTKNKRNYIYISTLRLKLEISQQQLVNVINSRLNLNIQRPTYTRWERGQRNFPDKIYSFVKDYLETQEKNMVPQIERFDTNDPCHKMKDLTCQDDDSPVLYHKLKDMTCITEELSDTINKEMNDTNSLKSNQQKQKKELNIIKTQNNYNENNNTDLLINLINQINNQIYNSLLIEQTDKDFLNACFEKLKLFKKFFMNRDNHMIEEEELIQNISQLTINQISFDGHIINILDKMKNSGYSFQTPDNQINCFLTFLFNDLKTREENPAWFIQSPQESTFIKDMKKNTSSEHDQFDDDIKNLNWWE